MTAQSPLTTNDFFHLPYWLLVPQSEAPWIAFAAATLIDS